MDFYEEVCVPPLITMNGASFKVFSTVDDIHMRLKSKSIWRAKAIIIHDPDGSLLKLYGNRFKRRGYAVKTLDTVDFSNSTGYNPFEYVMNENDVMKLAAALIKATAGLSNDSNAREYFLEHMLCAALISYLCDMAPTNEKNVKTLIYMLDYMKQEEWEYEDGFMTAVDFLFESKAEYDPSHMSPQLYKCFKTCAGKEGQSIVESLTAKLAPLNTDEVSGLISGDGLELDSFAYQKTALFVIDGDAKIEHRFLAPLMYAQLFDLLSVMNISYTQ